MNLELLLKNIESIIMSVKTRRPLFTGQLRLEINFYEGEPKDIVKEVERERDKIST